MFLHHQEEKTDAAGPCEDKEDINSVNDDDDHHAADEEENDEEHHKHKEVLTTDGPVTEGVKEEPCDQSENKDLSG